MPADFIETIEEFEDENGARYVVFKIQRPKENKPLKNIMIAGLEIAGEGALAAYMWKSNFHPAWLLMVSAMGAVSVTAIYQNIRDCINKLPSLIKNRLRLSCFLVAGVTLYFTAIHGFSLALRSDNNVWVIICLGAAAINYNLAVTSMTVLGRTVMDRPPFMKCWQLLFGPALIGSASLYLLSFRKHDEDWVVCLPMIASAIVGGLITSSGYGRVESNNEPRWLLFKGLEILIGGCLLLTNGTVLLAYGASKQFPPVYVAVFASMIFIGVTDINNSLETFQGCVEMEAPMFYSICGMIGGQIIFTSACICIGCIDYPNLLPEFIVMAGTGLCLLGKSVKDLHSLVPRPVFKRYCQRVLGPVVTVYSSLAAAYLGYRMGWQYSLMMMPLTAAGIYATYNGFRRRNRTRRRH